jgi:hypothetical protein
MIIIFTDIGMHDEKSLETTGTEHWWNNDWQGKYLERGLFHFQSEHHKYATDCHGILNPGLSYGKSVFTRICLYCGMGML